jgi:hypothetical protein
MSNPRVSLIRAVLCAAVGGLLVLLASGREWAQTKVQVPAGPRVVVTATGHAIEPALPALGIALLALAAAIIAGRGVIRRVVGIAIALAAAGALVTSVIGRGHVSRTLSAKEPGGLGISVHGSANLWWLVAVVGAVLALASGIVTAARGPRWVALGAKYEAPSTAPRVVTPSVDAWDALDRGEDPTR